MGTVTQHPPEADWDSFEATVAKRYRQAGLAWPGVVVRVRSPMVGALAAPIAAEVLTGRRSDESPAKLRDRMDECLWLNLRLPVDGPTDEAITVAVRQAVGLDRVPAEPSQQPLTELLDGGRTVWSDDDPTPHVLLGTATAGVAFLGGLMGWFPLIVGGRGSAVLLSLASAVVAMTIGFVARQCSLTVRRSLCRRPRFLAQQLGGADELSRDNLVEAVERGLRSAVRPEMMPKFHLRGQFLASPGEHSHAGWWWPHERFVMVSDRPQVVETDHIAWSEGWRCPP